jgi:hypothetical protein
MKTVIEKIAGAMGEASGLGFTVKSIKMGRSVWSDYRREVLDQTGLSLSDNDSLYIREARVDVQDIDDSYHEETNKIELTCVKEHYV